MVDAPRTRGGKGAIRAVPHVRDAPAVALPAPHLPVETTPFVGRDADLAALDALFGRGERLVTLTGPGGMGKTRLAVRWAAQRARDFPGGVTFCDLGGARDGRGICAVVQEALALPPGAGETDERAAARVGRALAGRPRSLVVLDNFEQVVAHAPATVARWVRDTRDACLLVTSREVLRVAGETAHELGPLDAHDGAALLVERAGRVRRGYAPADAERPVLDELVRRVDGIPLAIELLAARMAVLDARGVREKLAHGEDVLGHGARDATAQRRTLRATIEGSLALLSTREQRALAWLSVFRGGFDVALAEAMLGDDALELVQALREKSLVYAQEPAGLAGTLRLGLYAPIAELMRERLAQSGEEDLARRKHLEAVLVHSGALAERIEQRSSDENHRRAALEEENLVAALDYAVSPPADRARLSLALGAIPALDAVFNARGLVTRLVRVASRVIDAARAVRPDPVPLAVALRTRAAARGTLGLRDDALADLGEALELATKAGDRRLVGRVLASRGRVRWQEPEPARIDLEAALAIHRETGDRRWEAITGNSVASALHTRAHEDEARAMLLRTRDVFREVGDLRWVAIVESQVATLALERGRLDEASEALARARTLADEVGAWNAEVMVRQGEALVLHGKGEHAAAVRVYDDVVGLHERVGNRPYAAMFRGYRAAARRALGENARARLELEDVVRDLVEATDLRHAITFESHLAGACAALGAHDDAARVLAEADAHLPAAATDPRIAVVLDLGRAECELARAEEARAAGDADHARALREAARERLALAERAASHDAAPPGSVLASSFDARESLRLAMRALGSGRSIPPPTTPARDAIVVHHDGRWFRVPGGETVDASTRHVARRLLLRLGEERLRRPGHALDVEEMLRAGWPGERMLPHAAKNRLHVAIASLRKLGLRDVLRSAGDGYLLDPDVPFELV